MSPIEALVTAIAYVIHSDNTVRVEEKAKIVTVLGKHISKRHFTDSMLKAIAKTSFDYAGRVDVDTILAEYAHRFTHGQRLCIMFNLFDVIYTDGNESLGENEIVDKFRRAFDLDVADMRAIRDIMILKNATTMFLEPNHPYNSDDYSLDVRIENS